MLFFLYVVFSNVQPSNGLEFSYSSSPPTTTTCSSLNYQLCPRKSIFAVLWKDLTIQFSTHQIYTHLHLTVFTGPSYMESPAGFFTRPSPSNVVSPCFIIEPLPSVAFTFLFIRTFKNIEKQIHIPSSCKTMPDCQTWTLTFYPLGHWYRANQIDLNHDMSNIKPL